MKKCVVALFCLLLTATLTVSVFAAKSAKMTINAEQTTAKPGDTVSFSVTLEKVEDCRSAGVSLSYDEAVFEFVQGACSVKSAMVSSFKNNTGVFTVGDPAPIGGEIFTFQLKVKDNAPAGSYGIDAKGSLRDGNGAVETAVLGANVAVSGDGAQPTQPAVTVPTVPAEVVPTVPVVAVPTEPTQTTEQTTTPEETKPEEMKQMDSVQEPVYTIGAEEPPKTIPQWIWIAVAVLGIGAAALVSLRKKK